MTTKNRGGSRPNAGRKQMNHHRGRLVPVMVRLYEDQVERLKSSGNLSAAVREAVDEKVDAGQK